MRLVRADIAEGLEDVSRLLGFPPDAVVYIHSMVIDAADSYGRLASHISPFGYIQCLNYIPRTNKGNTSKAIILNANANFLSYLDEVGLAPTENIINLKLPIEELSAESLNVQRRMLNEQWLNKDKTLASLHGCTLVSSFLSGADQDLASVIQGRLIMKPEEQIKFNSKVFMRDMCQRHGIPLPLGVSVSEQEALAESLDRLARQCLSIGIDPSKHHFWCKMDEQSSGAGMARIKGLGPAQVEDLYKRGTEFAHKLNDGSTGFVPMVVELDCSELPNTNLVSNIGVEAVISDEGVALIGSVRQFTNDDSKDVGRYLGSAIDENLEKYSDTAENAASAVCAGYWREGYRGCITIDTLVTSSDTVLTGHCIDPNPRFSGGTMLLSLQQYASKMRGGKVYGFTYFINVPRSDNIWNLVTETCGDDLYRGAKTKYLGLIPQILNDRTESGPHHVQMASLGASEEDARSVFDAWKHRVRNFKPAST